MKTQEGETTYKAGDYLVYNNEDSTDGYAMSAASFESMYALGQCTKQRADIARKTDRLSFGSSL